jgi:hypothetical protein
MRKSLICKREPNWRLLMEGFTGRDGILRFRSPRAKGQTEPIDYNKQLEILFAQFAAIRTARLDK